jgi:hypothetical protein
MAGVSAVSPAAADPPNVTLYPDYGTTYLFPDPVNHYASRCDFPVTYQDQGKGVEIEFASGRFFATGPGLRATVTNVVTGASVDLTVNGSVRISQTPVGAEGHYVEVMTFSGPTINLSPGQLTWFTGRKVIVTEYDQFGTIVTQKTSQTGPSLDVCAALAR